MNRLNVNSIVYLLLSVAVIGSLFFLNTLTLNRLGVTAKVNFNIDDFMIKDFGIGGDGNPFLTVEGKAGETVLRQKIPDTHMYS